jgi:deoxyribonuclease IV
MASAEEKNCFKVLLGPAGVPHSSKAPDTISGILRVAELGLQAMEVEFVRGVHMNMPTAKVVGEAAKAAGVSLSVHAPYYVNLCSDDRKIYEASKKRILDSAELAGAMGAWIVALHPGYYSGMDPALAADRIGNACKEMVPHVPKGVMLGLETGGRMAAFGTLKETVDLCKKSKGCVPVVDFAHVYARQGGKIDYKQVLEIVSPLGLKMLHSHFSNIEFTDKGERRHLPVDHSPPFAPLAKEIILKKQNITLISESPLLEEDSIRMKKTLARSGYAF